MNPEFSKEILSWCFAAAVAWFLLRWVTLQLSEKLSAIITAVKLQSLTTLELYRLLLVHDAQTRHIDPNMEDDKDAIHRLAFDEYQKINDSLASLKEQISKH